jgi:hypothetical protein
MSDVVIIREESVVTFLGDGVVDVDGRVASTVVIQTDGIPGRKGDKGDPGETVFTGNISTFSWSPPSAQSIWNISHNQNRFPSVTVVDNLGREVLADLTYLDANVVSLEFGIPMSGTAFIN